jgi:PHD-finger
MVFPLNLDGTPSVSCSKCDTWMHIACVPEHLAKNLEGDDFLCEACCEDSGAIDVGA